MELTREQVKMLAKAERMTDTGELKYVLFDGRRLIVESEVMEQLGLQPCQTINWEIFGAIQQENLQRIQLKIQLERIKNQANN